jgi:tetratricopeptide (TPR) repeat protein
VAAHPRCEADLLPLLVAKASALERLTLPHEADVASAVALDAARRRGDEDLLAEALLTRAAVEVLHTPALAPSVLDEALQLLERRGDEAGLARLRWQRAWREVDGGLDIPLALTERAHHVGVMTGDQRLAAGAALDLAMQLPARDLDEAARWERAAAAVLREHDVVAPAKLAYARAYRESVRHEPALELAAALDLQRAGNAAALGRYEHYGRLFALEALTDLGRLEDAEALLDVVLADAEDRPVLTFVVNVGCREVALRARQGRVAEADAALTRVRALLQDDAAYYEAALLDAEGVALLERGHFDAAHTALDRAHALDVDIDQPALGLRVQLRRMVAALSAGRQVPLVDTRQLRVTARGMGAPTIAALASRWFELHDALRAHNDHFLDLPEAPDLPEARALDREITVLRAGDPDGLLDAAREWSTLGSVVWTARALLWHSELTGTEHPEADELLRVLQSPEGLAEAFRAQVRGLRG